MKKVLSTCLALVLVIGMVACLAGCGSKGPSGRYDLVSVEEDGMTMDMDALRALAGDEGDKLEIYIEFNEGGTGKLVSVDGSIDMTWDEKTITGEGEDPVNYELSGKTLTVSAEGSVMTFEKK